MSEQQEGQSQQRLPVVSVKGRYLVTTDDDGNILERFLMKGIAFPVTKQRAGAGGNNGNNNVDGVDDNGVTTLTSSSIINGWISILYQLKQELQLDINTIRIYNMDPNLDYSEFFHVAESLGIYVIVPLTSTNKESGGILDRSLQAPNCYTRDLYNYGIKCIENYSQYNNVLAGVIGNEIMNNLQTWYSAPCIKSYIRDLNYYMNHRMMKSKQSTGGNSFRRLPLLYAAQDSGLGAALPSYQHMKITELYLSCTDKDYSNESGNDNGNGNDKNGGGSSSSSSSSSSSGGGGHINDHVDHDVDIVTDVASIDIFGINVESWCSSNNTLLLNEDATTGSYYELYTTLKENSTSVIVFSEMGCPKDWFNRDNTYFTNTNPNYTAELENLKHVRDWKQIQYILGDGENNSNGGGGGSISGGNSGDTTDTDTDSNELHTMVDLWSGFCVYTYNDGNINFNMFQGIAASTNGSDGGGSTTPIINDGLPHPIEQQQLTVWNGKDILQPTKEVEYFKYQLDLLKKKKEQEETTQGDGHVQDLLNSPNPKRPTCSRIKYEMETCCYKVFDDLRHLHNAGGPPGSSSGPPGAGGGTAAGGGGGLFGNNNNGNGNDILYDYTKIPSYFKADDDKKDQNPIQAIISRLFGTKTTTTTTSTSSTSSSSTSKTIMPPSSSTTMSVGGTTSSRDSTFHVSGNLFIFLSLLILGIISYTGIYKAKKSRRRQQQQLQVLQGLQYHGGDQQDKEQETIIIINRSRDDNDNKNNEQKVAGKGITTTKYGSI